MATREAPDPGAPDPETNMRDVGLREQYLDDNRAFSRSAAEPTMAELAAQVISLSDQVRGLTLMLVGE